MWRESPHQPSFPSFYTDEKMWRGIALSTYFSPIWFWQRDVGGNPSIPLICYLLILTERYGWNAPIRFIAHMMVPESYGRKGDVPINLLLHIWYWQGCRENPSINFIGRSVCSTTASVLQIPTTTTTPPPPPIIPNRREMREVLW